MKKEKIEKNSQETATTQPEYVEVGAGKVFTPADIATKGFKPKGKYKGHSLSERVSSPEFGSLKRKKRKSKIKKLSYASGEKSSVKTPSPSQGESGARGFSMQLSGGYDATDPRDENTGNVGDQSEDEAGLFNTLVDLADAMDAKGEVVLADFTDFLIKKFAEVKDYDPTDGFNNLIIKINRMDIPNTSDIIKKLTNIYSRTITLEYANSKDLDKAKNSAYKKVLHRADQYISEG